MSKQLRSVFVACSALLLSTSCGDLATAPTNSEALSTPLSRVASATAVALRDPEVRRFVIAEMRASPWVEHKVGLHEVMSGQSNPLRTRAAKAAALSDEEFSQLLQQISEMDFYMAQRADRHSWTKYGESPIVAASSDHKTFHEFDAEGRASAARSGRLSSRQPLFLIHPRERQAFRVGRPEVLPVGSVIEDPADGQGGLIITVEDQNGHVTQIDVGKSRLTVQQAIAHLRPEIPPGSDAKEKPASSNMLSYTTLTLYEVSQYMSDVGGSAEVEFKAWKHNSSGNCCRVQFRWEGVDPLDVLVADDCTGSGHPQCVEGPLVLWLNWYPGFDSYTFVRAKMWETDTGDDDDYGYGDWFIGDSGESRVYFGFLSGGNTDCGYFGPGEPHPCGTATVTFF